MNKFKLCTFPVIWFFLVFFVFVPLYLVGIPLTLLASLLRRYSWDEESRRYYWKDRLLRKFFQTPDNGACPNWYLVRFNKRPVWYNVFVWSGLRNPVGWQGLSRMVAPREVKFYGNSSNPVVSCMTEGRFSWHVVQKGWLCGVWLVWPIFKKSKSDHFEVRLGWKMLPGRDYLPSYVRFTPWDVGRRIA